MQQAGWRRRRSAASHRAATRWTYRAFDVGYLLQRPLAEQGSKKGISAMAPVAMENSIGKEYVRAVCVLSAA